MKALLYIVIPMLLLQTNRIAAQNTYSTDKGVITFYAEAPVANVDARNEKVKAKFNPSTHELTFDANMADFQFKNSKMGRDAQTKYLETEKYPKASFKGKINSKINYDKPGTYPVTVAGTLKIHGTEKKVTEKGTVVIKEKQIALKSEFFVMLKDYNIETPKILGKEMTADKIKINVEAMVSEEQGLASGKKKD
jgi:polyisoprenoid-binding protein YceI